MIITDADALQFGDSAAAYSSMNEDTVPHALECVMSPLATRNKVLPRRIEILTSTGGVIYR